MTSSNDTPQPKSGATARERGPSASTRCDGLRLAAFVAVATLCLSGSQTLVADWLEPVSSEIPAWRSAALGWNDDEAASWTLDIDPQVLRAAELLIPDNAQLASDDRWWFPAEISTNGRRYSVRAQLVQRRNGDEGIRVRFAGRARPEGIESIEFIVADGQRHGVEWVARETAREVGLITPPTGFTRLSINGGKRQIVYWRETATTSMLQRLGYPEGEIFRASEGAQRGPNSAQLPGHYAASLDRTPARAHVAALTHLVDLVDRLDSFALGNRVVRFERELARIVDIDKLLAWEALTHLFGARRADSVSSDWYFNPITGLLEPVFSSANARDTASGSEAGMTARALLASRARLQERDALLRDWVGTTQSLLLADADRKLGEMVARVAGGSSWYARARDLTSLAELRRGVRQTIRLGVADLRSALAARAAVHPHFATTSNSPSSEQLAQDTARAREWVAASGLPFEVEGEWLRLPAGYHHVASTLVVPETHRLRLDPGAHLVMAPRTSVITFRGVEAIGTRRAPISIRGLDAQRPWGAIGIARARETSQFAYVTVADGSDAKFEGIEFTGQLSLNHSDVVIRDSDIVRGHADDSLSVKRGSFQVSRSRFIDNRSDGFDAEWSSGSIEQCLFASNGDEGLDLGTSEVRVHRTWFRRMGDKAISAGERSRVSVTDSRLVGSQIAIASKEDSRVDVRGSEFRRNEIGISLYRDNAVFGSGYSVVSGGLFSENLRDFAVESGSGLTLNGVERRASDDSGIVVGLHSAHVPTPSTIQ
ncbi:MAG: right-handed parallel beta-helix repeat-containing protein [Myxococcota bacterium]|nr:right-handed parallel beta-helix repeat-containing protein [Myxococcota bacterium]